MPVIGLPQGLANYPFGNTNILTVPPINVGANGLFVVTVVNELTSTATVTPDVQVNVFISASDDFEVCVPSCDHLQNISYAPGISSDPGPPTLFEAQAGDSDPVDPSVEDVPLAPTTINTMAPTLSTSDHTLDVFFGDPVTSFRQCLKRYEFSRAWQLPFQGGTKYTLAQLRLPDVPLFKGAVDGAVDTAVNDDADPTPWNYVKFTLLNYLLPAYAARRGNIRWKYHLTANDNDPAYFAATIEEPGLGYSAVQIPMPSWADGQINVIAQTLNQYLPHTWCATHVTDVRNNPVLEIEIPYYRYLRFFYSRDLNVTSVGRYSTSYHTLTAIYPATYTAGYEAAPMIHSYVSVGEDFSLFFFTGVPPLFIVNDPPALVF